MFYYILSSPGEIPVKRAVKKKEIKVRKSMFYKNNF